ncbi:MAG: acyl-CoA dehydrogenase family protein, partial [Aeromonas sp.]
MDFTLTDDQQAYVEAAAAFADDALKPHAARWDKEHEFPIPTIKQAAELGFCGLYTPEQFGGLGLPRLDASLIFERLAMGCTSTTAYLTIHNMVSWMLGSWLPAQVAEEWVPKLASGELLGSYCLTEPGAGSDAAALKTRAVREGDSYLIEGTKVFISGAGSTDVLVVMARTGGEGASGISAFMVPADSAGIVYGKPEEKLGWNSQPTREVAFNGVRIPASYRLGEEGDGFKFAMQALDGGRINIAACSVGTAQQALDDALAYVQQRQQFGRPISEFQSVQFRLADMATELAA